MALDGTRHAAPALLAADGRAFSRESTHAEHLPYFAVAAPNALITREGDLMATMRLDGLNPMTTPDGDLDALRRSVAAIVAQTGDLFGFYVHRISVPQDLRLRPIEGDGFAAEIDRRWQHHVAGLQPKKKQLYLTILRRPELSARLPVLRHFATRAWVKDRAARLQELNEVTGFFEVALAAARPLRLTTDGGEWLGLLNTLNSGRFAPIAIGQSALPLAHALSDIRATFEGDTIVVTDAVTGERRYGAGFSIKSYPALTDVTLLDGLDLPLDIVLTNSFTPIPTNIMAERIQRIIRQMHASDDAAVSLREQLAIAADDQEAGRIAFGNHHLSIAVYAESREMLERAAAQIKRAGQEIMAVIVREKMALKATYFAQHPGNFGYRARRTPISSVNFADFAALHGSVVGRSGHSPRGDLGVGDHLVDGLHRRGGHPSRIQRRHAGRHGRLRLRPGAHEARHLLAVRVAPGGAVKAAVGGQGLAADELREFCPDFVDLRRNDEVAVRRGKGAVDGGIRLLRTGPHRHHLAAREAVGLYREIVHRHHAVVERKVEVLALAAALAPKERGTDRGDAVRAGIHVGQRHPEQRWRLPRVADHGHCAALGLGDQAEAGTLGIGAGLAIGGDRAVDEARVHLGEIFVSEAEFLQRAGAVVFDEDIRRLQQPLHQLAALLLPQIETEALLAHVLLQEIAAVIAGKIRVAAARVAQLGPLDLDDLGPH
jgi:hypothetical protein